MGSREASPQAQSVILGTQVASGGSGSFPCRGTDELLGVMDQVTIVNSTLGKALGGASGAYRLVPLGSPHLRAGPWKREGGEGRPGAAGKETAGTVFSGGAWGKLWLLASDCPPPSPPLSLFSGGYTTGPGSLVSLLRQRARPYLFSNSLPPAVVGCASKALDLLMESNAIIQSMAAKTQRCGLGQGGASGGEEAGEGLPCMPAQALAPCLRVLPLPTPLPQRVALGLGSLGQGLPACPAPSSVCLFLPFPGTFLCKCSPSASLGLHLCLCWSLLQTWPQTLGHMPIRRGCDCSTAPQLPVTPNLCPQIPQ